MRTDRGADWPTKNKLLLLQNGGADAELETQLRQAQKMESVGQLAAGVAHDFNNLLTIIQGHAGLLLSTGSPDPLARESVRQISLAAERAANLTRQLLMFIRKQTMQPRLLDLNEVIANIFKMLRALAGDQVTLRRNLAARARSILKIFAIT